MASGLSGVPCPSTALDTWLLFIASWFKTVKGPGKFPSTGPSPLLPHVPFWRADTWLACVSRCLTWCVCWEFGWKVPAQSHNYAQSQILAHCGTILFKPWLEGCPPKRQCPLLDAPQSPVSVDHTRPALLRGCSLGWALEWAERHWRFNTKATVL